MITKETTANLERIRIRKLLMFSLTVFWPGIFFFCFYGWLIARVFPITIKTISVPLIQKYIFFGFIFVLPALIVIACYRRCLRANWRQRGWILYAGWFGLMTEIGFLIASAVGGVSMAVADGANPFWVRYIQYLFASLLLTLMAHLFFVPWTALSLWIMKKIGESRFFDEISNQ